MRNALLALIIVCCLLLSGCLSPTEKERVNKAAYVARQMATHYDVEKPDPPKDMLKFLEANARAWEAFNEAVNGEGANNRGSGE